jgi:CheY-like chemotaxis protein
MKRILVIDDDPFAPDFYRSLLEPKKCEVTVVPNAKDGVRMFHDRLFDLVVLNIFLPGMAGLIALQELAPKTSGVPIVAIAGEPAGKGADAMRFALALGARRAFRRSFEFLDFIEAIEELTETHPATT